MPGFLSSKVLTAPQIPRVRVRRPLNGADLVPRLSTISQKFVVVIEPLDINVAGGMMVDELNGIPCGGRTVVSVNYPATPDPTSGSVAEDTAGGSIAVGMTALDAILRTPPVSQSIDVLVFGHSRGAQVASSWLRHHGNDANKPNPRYVKFLLTGNPERKYGGIPFAGRRGDAAVTPNNTPYAVQDLKIQYDGWADWPTTLPRPNWQSTQNAVQGMHTTHIADYKTHNPSDATMFYTENTTVYAMIPNNLPMFDAYRRNGQTALADRLQAQMQPIIETQYVRPEKPTQIPPPSVALTRPRQPVVRAPNHPPGRPSTIRPTRAWL